MSAYAIRVTDSQGRAVEDHVGLAKGEARALYSFLREKYPSDPRPEYGDGYLVTLLRRRGKRCG